VSWEKIIEHIDHVVKLVGRTTWAWASDFDGADMPEGLEDCSKLLKITEALVRKGYKEDDIRKILGAIFSSDGTVGEKQQRDAGDE